MAAGNRYESGKPSDIVKHYKDGSGVLCGRKNIGYSSSDASDITCKNCLKKLNAIPINYLKAYEYLDALNDQVQEHGEIKIGKDHFYWSTIAELYKDKKTK